MFDVACIDVETTGLSPRKGHRIIEVGLIIMQGELCIGEYHSFITADCQIPDNACRIHGITNSMLVDQPRPEKVFPALKRLIDGNLLVAHNAPFDISFLRHEYGRLGMLFNNRFSCTLERSRMKYPTLRNHRLDTVYRHISGSEAQPFGRMEIPVIPICQPDRGSPVRIGTGTSSSTLFRDRQYHNALDDARKVAAIWLAMRKR